MKSENPGNETAFLPERALSPAEVPQGMDRRAFMMRSAVMGAVAVITGCSPETPPQQAPAPAAAPPPPTGPALSPELDVVKRSKGPVMTTLEEFYKVGPGPSS